MAKPATTANGGEKKKSMPRVNKPRTFYMVYKGELTEKARFVFDKDELVDIMTGDRDLKVERITVPMKKRSKNGVVPTDQPSAPTAVA